MLKTATIRARLSPSLKEEVEKTLASLGLTVSDAIQVLFHQIQLRKGLPFDVVIPNTTTARVLRDSKKGRGVKKFSSKAELFSDLGV
jgi:DNA-damage-inducible protein J